MKKLVLSIALLASVGVIHAMRPPVATGYQVNAPATGYQVGTKRPLPATTPTPPSSPRSSSESFVEGEYPASDVASTSTQSEESMRLAQGAGRRPIATSTGALRHIGY